MVRTRFIAMCIMAEQLYYHQQASRQLCQLPPPTLYTIPQLTLGYSLLTFYPSQSPTLSSGLIISLMLVLLSSIKQLQLTKTNSRLIIPPEIFTFQRNVNLIVYVHRLSLICIYNSGLKFDIVVVMVFGYI